ncbi:uncharacterized protein A4U43_C10F2370 [Asparagus officinalis]|uniref:NLP1-9 GAF domain-containing protein n=1 Tax=Asparagus officinalis TaxID=4686 RepID=A0A5P1E4G9_ASPOF|nr:uncharacterized protein A4U43_C10F2370 [Asparagus officinalis]
MGDASAQRPGSSLERAVSCSSVDFDLMDEMLSGDCWFQTNTPSLDTQENETPEQGSDQKLYLLIQPRSPTPPLKDRLIHALRRIKEAQRDSDVLVQIWVPIRTEGKHFLSTFGQPFWLDTNCQSLVSYRAASAGYQFSAEENSNEALGLPGRVFLGKVPEWTPDVRYFSSFEFPRVDHAQTCNVRGTIAIPVFERDSRSCLGVVEVVLTMQKINYSSDIESICSALQTLKFLYIHRLFSTVDANSKSQSASSLSSRVGCTLVNPVVIPAL